VKRTPGGRVKNAAVKYQKDADLEGLLDRAHYGAHLDHPAWMWVLLLTEAISKKQMKAVREFRNKDWKKNSAAWCVAEDGLKAYLALVIENKRWDEWDKIAKMFKAARAMTQNDWFPHIDPIRHILIRANFTLYGMGFLGPKGTTKKGLLLRIARKLFSEELLNKEDADLFKIMRELGLPRSPDQTTKYFKLYSDKWRPLYLEQKELLDKKKTNSQ